MTAWSPICSCGSGCADATYRLVLISFAGFLLELVGFLLLRKCEAAAMGGVGVPDSAAEDNLSGGLAEHQRVACCERE